MSLPVNTLLQGGKYKIVRFISSGGFGCTYEAEHIMLEKRVAIKEFFIKDFCNRDENTAHVTIGTLSKKGLVEKLRRKFIDEAKALCRLQHSGIVSVQDVFEENGTAYFVMDYVDGKSLSEILKEQGPLPEERAVRYIRQVATALQYVHDNNRLHLDIKPGNIMIDGNDNPVLIDFGASKQYDEEDGENTSTLMGKTPGYAPPEQMSNSVVKFLPATDIYALGATLYKLLTGITPLDVNLRISGEELEPLPTNISATTRNAITAAMEINKNKRPQTVAAFMELLKAQPASTEETIFDAEESAAPKVVAVSKPNEYTSKQSGKKSKSYIGIIVGVIIVAVLGAGAYWGVNQWREAQWQAEAAERQRLTEEAHQTEQEESQRLTEEKQKKENAENQKTITVAPIVPKPQKQLKQSNLPFNPSGCPYVYIKGNDRATMIKNKSIDVNIYGRKYTFTIGDAHPNGTRALVVTEEYGVDLFAYLDFSTDDMEAFFDELYTMKEECNMQLSILDVDDDDECEVLLTLQSEGYITTNTYVFRLLPHPYKETIVKYIGVAEGQIHMYINGKSIVAPYGSQGLYVEYIISPNDRLINISD